MCSRELQNAKFRCANFPPDYNTQPPTTFASVRSYIYIYIYMCWKVQSNNCNMVVVYSISLSYTNITHLHNRICVIYAFKFV